LKKHYVWPKTAWSVIGYIFNKDQKLFSGLTGDTGVVNQAGITGSSGRITLQ